MKIFTDGSANPNPGRGGYGVVLMNDAETEVLNIFSHQEENTTNNIQELKALIVAFTIAKACPNAHFIIYADSAYAIGVFTQWAASWKRNGWQKSDKQPIKNLELIQKGYKLYCDLNNCEIKKVKGHENNIGNELADALAGNNIEKFSKYSNLINK